MAKPVCTKCRLFYKPKKNGFVFIEGMPKPGTNNSRPKGVDGDDHWIPYKLWNGDLWECKGCGSEIIVTGHQACTYHHDPIFQEYIREFQKHQIKIPQVNDC